jgi:hypothetical protein
LLAQAEAETAEVSTADLARGKSSLSALSATVATQAAIIASDQLRKEELSKQIEELRSTLAFMHPPAPAPSAAATDSMPQVATATSSDDTRAFAAQTQLQSAYGSNADAAVAHSHEQPAVAAAALPTTAGDAPAAATAGDAEVKNETEMQIDTDVAGSRDAELYSGEVQEIELALHTCSYCIVFVTAVKFAFRLRPCASAPRMYLSVSVYIC